MVVDGTIRCPLCDKEVAYGNGWTEWDRLAQHVATDHVDDRGVCVCGERFETNASWGDLGPSLADHLASLGPDLEAHLILGVLAQ